MSIEEVIAVLTFYRDTKQKRNLTALETVIVDRVTLALATAIGLYEAEEIKE